MTVVRVGGGKPRKKSGIRIARITPAVGFLIGCGIGTVASVAEYFDNTVSRVVDGIREDRKADVGLYRGVSAVDPSQPVELYDNGVAFLSADGWVIRFIDDYPDGALDGRPDIYTISRGKSGEVIWYRGSYFEHTKRDNDRRGFFVFHNPAIDVFGDDSTIAETVDADYGRLMQMSTNVTDYRGTNYGFLQVPKRTFSWYFGDAPKEKGGSP